MVNFKLCGGLEAPGWLLAQVASLAKVSSVRVKIAARDVATHILGGTLKFAQIKELVAEHGLGLSDLKVVISVLDYVLKGAVKFNVDTADFATELEQLGLPRETAASVSRVYAAQKEALRARQEARSLQLPRLASLEWSVDCIVASSSLADVSEPTVHLKLATTHTLNSAAPRDAGSVGAGGAAGAGAGASSGHGKPFTMEVGLDKFRVLHNELKQARLLMKSL